MPRIEIFANAEELAEYAAGEFLELAGQKLKTGKAFQVALSGGSTPGLLYRRLAKTLLDWNRVEMYWVDERCVPPDHPDSNYRMTAETLLGMVDIPKANIHRIPGELPPEKAAEAYQRDLKKAFKGKFPVFDLILLGIGTDGHTASLFPGSPALEETMKWAAPVRHDSPPSPLVDRVTLTYPILQAGNRVVFLVSGKEKSGILETIFTRGNDSGKIPAGKFLEHKATSWFLDQEAASKLNAQVESNRINIRYHSSHME